MKLLLPKVGQFGFAGVLTLGLLAGPGAAIAPAQAPVMFENSLNQLRAARTYRSSFANKENRDFAALLSRWRDGPYDARLNIRKSLDGFLGLRPKDRSDPALDLAISEAVNELLQGQILEGNQSLLDALRTRFPRLDNPRDPPARLPLPEGNSGKELEGLDRAIESFGLGYRAALAVLPTEGGEGLLRTSAAAFEGFPQFTLLKRPFEPPGLNKGNGEYPVQVEMALFSNCADRAGQASVEKAKKLFNMSGRPGEEVRKAEALTELKRGTHHAYVLAAALAATQTEQEFQDNGCQNQLVHTLLARQLFDRINAGMTPFGNSKTFIPNSSMAQFIKRADAAVAEARRAEIDARNDQRAFDMDQGAMRNELQSQRDRFLGPLKLLTNLDPTRDLDLDRDGRVGEKEPEGVDLDGDGRAGEYESFDRLTTIRGRALYRKIVTDRVNELLRGEYVPGKTTSSVGQLGTRILNVRDAQLSLQQAYNTLQNIPERIAIEKERSDAVVSMTHNGAKKMGALQMAKAMAGAVNVSTGVASPPMGAFCSVNINPGALQIGSLESAQTLLQAVQTADIEGANSKATIKNLLLEQANALIDLQRAKLRFDQEMTGLEQEYQKLDQLIVDYADTVKTADALWFNDPTYRITLSEKIRRANTSLEDAIVALYELSRALAYEWNEEYRNPVIIPPDVQGVEGTLESRFYDQFTRTEDLFGIQSADEARDFFDALREWDKKLRTVGNNGVSVRGPNRGLPEANRPISLRDDVLGLGGDKPEGVKETDRISRFREFLGTKLYRKDAATPGFQFTFGLNLEVPKEPTARPLLPFSDRWNLRIAAVIINTDADEGFVELADCTFFLTQAGVISNQTFFDNTRQLKERVITKYFVPVADRPERSVFRATIPSRVNGRADPVETYERGQELAGGANFTARPLAATQWQLTLDPTQTKNFRCDITKLRDIKIVFKYDSGNPPAFPW